MDSRLINLLPLGFATGELRGEGGEHVLKEELPRLRLAQVAHHGHLSKRLVHATCGIVSIRRPVTITGAQ